MEQQLNVEKLPEKKIFNSPITEASHITPNFIKVGNCLINTYYLNRIYTTPENGIIFNFSNGEVFTYNTASTDQVKNLLAVEKAIYNINKNKEPGKVIVPPPIPYHAVTPRPDDQNKSPPFISVAGQSISPHIIAPLALPPQSQAQSQVQFQNQAVATSSSPNSPEVIRNVTPKINKGLNQVGGSSNNNSNSLRAYPRAFSIPVLPRSFSFSGGTAEVSAPNNEDNDEGTPGN